jgi:hypothetical protein
MQLTEVNIMSQEPQSVQSDSAIIPVASSAIQLGTLQAASPAALITGAGEMAKALAEVIRHQQLALTIQGRKYVKVEGWTTLGIMLGVVAREVTTVEQDGIYTATVELVRISDQAVISRASAECGSADELDRYGKPVWANRPRYARRSMAQTRATGKACRLAFSWIMALAGYEPTPAEEMPNEEPPREEKPIGKQSPEHRHLEARLQELGLDRERVKAWCTKKWGVEHLPDLTASQYRELSTRLSEFARKSAGEEAKTEREAIQAEAISATTQQQENQTEEPLTEDQRKAKAMLEQAKQIEQQAQYADGQAYYQELERARKLRDEAYEILRI